MIVGFSHNQCVLMDAKYIEVLQETFCEIFWDILSMVW